VLSKNNFKVLVAPSTTSPLTTNLLLLFLAIVIGEVKLKVTYLPLMVVAAETAEPSIYNLTFSKSSSAAVLTESFFKVMELKVISSLPSAETLILAKVACLSPNLTLDKVPSLLIVNWPKSVTVVALISLPLIGKEPETVAVVKISAALLMLKP